MSASFDPRRFGPVFCATGFPAAVDIAIKRTFSSFLDDSPCASASAASPCRGRFFLVVVLAGAFPMQFLGRLVMIKAWLSVKHLSNSRAGVSVKRSSASRSSASWSANSRANGLRRTTPKNYS